MTEPVEAVDWSTLPGRLVVLSGASGAGKSTIVHRLIDRAGGKVRRSVSATTRAPREGEVPGLDYHFVTVEEFESLRGDLLESAEVHGSWYGTPASPVREALARGECVILVIDVQGGFQIRRKVPNALLVFIQAPSLEELEARLRDRGTDSEATIARRLTNARREIEAARAYDVQLVNDDLEACVDALTKTLAEHRCARGMGDD
ncbi:guanylate kinase [Paludisphaera rhizosphaerae]|uniref:guanylate kinase n=1 Tax=Paludisphaera rhizosphaerae TaxID=2711216 RepID=UPI0013EB1024|nr:guanylate kinase [Paludisphaera rhizosphaerae]